MLALTTRRDGFHPRLGPVVLGKFCNSVGCSYISYRPYRQSPFALSPGAKGYDPSPCYCRIYHLETSCGCGKPGLNQKTRRPCQQQSDRHAVRIDYYLNTRCKSRLRAAAVPAAVDPFKGRAAIMCGRLHWHRTPAFEFTITAPIHPASVKCSM